MSGYFKAYGVRFGKALVSTLPIIVFFLISFAIVYQFFGLHYLLVVSMVTIFFQVRHKQSNNTLIRYVRLFLVGSCLVVVSYFCNRSLLSCILLNFLVPFVLVFTQSSQFNPKGYFSYAMIYVFCSLMPPEDLAGLWTELTAFWSCLLLLAVSITVYRRFFAAPGSPSMSARQAILELSALIPMLAEPDRTRELEQKFSKLLEDCHRMSYHQKFFTFQTRENQLYDMISTLIQRFSYMLADHEWRKELDPSQIETLERVGAYLRELAGQMETLAPASPARKKLMDEAQALLDGMDIPEGRVRIFCRSALHMANRILRTFYGEPHAAYQPYRLDRKEIRRQIRLRLDPESFEMRFAMRLAIVMTISGTISYFLPITHSYWIPLNAFLLLQPSYEDSSYRMKTRPIGTFLACCIMFLAYPFLTSLERQLTFAIVMTCLMYCSTPGTWYQPIFSTCYALTMAAMSMDQQLAITLRLADLGAAVLIVFLVNRFFFPVRRDVQFTYNIKSLFRLHNQYWDIIRSGLYGSTNLAVSNEILTHFHTIYADCRTYLEKHTELHARKELEAALIILWHMFSELAQVHFLIRTNSVRSQEVPRFLQMIDFIQEELYPIISGENFPQLKKELTYREPEVTYVLQEYLKHAEELLGYQAAIPF